MRSPENQYIRLLRWLGYLTVFATSVSLYDRLWFFELFTHFTIQYLGILFLLVIVFLFYRNKRLVLLFLFFFSINLYKVYDHTTPQIVNNTLASQTIKIATLNLSMTNTQHSKVSAFIQDYSADVLLLTELTPDWLQNLTTLESIYPHSYVVPRKDGFGIALYSRFPMLNSKTVALDDPSSPAIVSEIDVNGAKVTVSGVHLFAPMTNKYFHARNRQLEKLAVLINDSKSPAIAIGDLNITSWSSFFSNFIEKTSLQESTTGQGLQPTWPSYFFPFYIQLDHILVSEEFFIVSSKSERFVGSDHYPLVAEIALANKK